MNKAQGVGHKAQGTAILNFVSVNHRVVSLPDNRKQFLMRTIMN